MKAKKKIKPHQLVTKFGDALKKAGYITPGVAQADAQSDASERMATKQDIGLHIAGRILVFLVKRGEISGPFPTPEIGELINDELRKAGVIK